MIKAPQGFFLTTSSTVALNNLTPAYFTSMQSPPSFQPLAHVTLRLWTC